MDIMLRYVVDVTNLRLLLGIKGHKDRLGPTSPQLELYKGIQTAGDFCIAPLSWQSEACDIFDVRMRNKKEM